MSISEADYAAERRRLKKITRLCGQHGDPRIDFTAKDGTTTRELLGTRAILSGWPADDVERILLRAAQGGALPPGANLGQFRDVDE